MFLAVMKLTPYFPELGIIKLTATLAIAGKKFLT